MNYSDSYNLLDPIVHQPHCCSIAVFPFFSLLLNIVWKVESEKAHESEAGLILFDHKTICSKLIKRKAPLTLDFMLHSSFSTKCRQESYKVLKIQTIHHLKQPLQITTGSSSHIKIHLIMHHQSNNRSIIGTQYVFSISY